MKITMIVMMLVFSEATAFAGSGGCISNDVELVCGTTYAPGAVQGPFGKDLIQDVEMEPFNPSVCKGTVVLFSDLGKFVAVYDAQDSSLRAWINANGKDHQLLKDVPLRLDHPVRVTVHGAGTNGIRSANFTCNLVD